ncbi:helix-turn-helix transcriptional regulator [Streptomyces sp. KLOTTS4A1]|uniref:helix-turn-helix transcriptional regulator n=1 Tax=Streptomyces sp. KLOTTS4A1 TaxID=3390996 RepID=UPI0039F63D98
MLYGRVYGRAGEQERIDRLLARARAGTSGALVIHGEAGIGKTTLLEHAARAAHPGRVLRTVGIEAEMELAFGGLHQLLRPVADCLDALPAPQAAALQAVFGLTGGEAVRDRFTVGLAVLTALSRAAADGPLLCLVDDAQWLDHASLDVLTFVARRLHTEGVMMLFAVRDGARGARIAGLPRLRLDGLDPTSADALLADRTPDLSPYVRDQIAEQAAGNPLALLEVPAALTAEQRAGQLNPVTLPVGLSSPAGRVQEAFQEQIRRLPAATRSMLLVAAADDTGDLGLILRASARFDADLGDLEPAERATLVQLTENTLSFRHPLIRSAAYQDAALARRFAAHRALADQLHGGHSTGHTTGHQADRRAWHLAAATAGIDEAVSEELADVARRAGGRQGAASASAAYERAAQLTGDPVGRARLLAAAAITSAEAGQFDRTAALADRIDALDLDPATLADFARVRAIVELDHGSVRVATRILIECADRIGSGPGLLPVLNEAVQTANSSGDRALIAEVGARLPATPEYATMRALTGPLGAGTPPQASQVPQPSQRPQRPQRPQPPQHPRLSHPRQLPGPEAGFAERLLAATHAQLLTDHHTALDIATACVRDCRDQDVVGWLQTALHVLAQVQLSLGRHAEAASAAAEGLAVAEQYGRHHRATHLRAALAVLAALNGEEERCRSLAEATLRHADAHDIDLAAAHAHSALGLLDLGSGRADSALHHLRAARGRVTHPLLSVFLLPDLVEAAVRAGQQDQAEEPLACLEQWVKAADTPAAAALLHRCRALTAPDDSAETHFATALDLHPDPRAYPPPYPHADPPPYPHPDLHPDAAPHSHGETDTRARARPFARARTELLYGEWLRRARRRSDARRRLRAALEVFEQLGAEPWAHRARTELQACGESVDQAAGPEDVLLARLSPRERDVVRLAAAGATNREIAARLFLSPRTVGHHLYRAYPKLGITSRTELPQVIG